MKIGIITQPLVNNYGGILQNYALQIVLKRIGHEPVTLNYGHVFRQFSLPFFIVSLIKRLLNTLLGRHNYKSLNVYAEEKDIFSIRPHQLKFIDNNIDKIEIHSLLTGKEDFLRDFDGFIVGSDQVWRPLYSPNIDNCFLDFVNNGQFKIAYAASFGTDKWELSKQLALKASKLLKDFNGISVRENSGIELCKEYLNSDAVHVLDPTMLLDRDDYNSLISNDEIETGSEKFIGVYILDQNKLIRNEIEKFAQEMNLKVKYLGEEKDGIKQSIETWLKDIRDAHIIITDSFHGTVFSIIFNTPFYTLSNDVRGNTRISSLLSLFGLEDRQIRRGDYARDSYDRICWKNVNKRILELKNHSLNFLNVSLHNKI